MPPDTFEGYSLISTRTAENGDTTHIYKKVKANNVTTPKTGDVINIMLYLGAASISAICIFTLLIYGRKSK